MEFRPSPNFSSRGGQDILGTVLHYTGDATTAGTIRWFQNPESGVSAHYIIGRDGRTVQMVKDTDKAWHAGTSEMIIDGESLPDANRFTIGVELCNHGLMQQIGSNWYYSMGRRLIQYNHKPIPQYHKLRFDSGYMVEGWWEPYPETQISALGALLAHIADNHGAPAVANIMGHEEIGMPLGRKTDPGPCFPWERIERLAPRRTRSV